MAANLCDLQTNYLQNNGFQLILPRFPHTAYYSTSFVLPSIELPNAHIQTPFSKIPLAGDEVIYEPFTFSFMLDDQMKNYREIYDWMFAIGYSKQYSDFKNFPNRGGGKVESLGEQDAAISILSGKSNPTAHIIFRDAIPIALSGVEFSTQGSTTEYLMATATFAYTFFEFAP